MPRSRRAPPGRLALFGTFTLLLLACGGGSAGPPKDAARADSKQPPSSSSDDKAICGDDSPPLFATTRDPRFVVGDDGSVRLTPDGAPTTFRVALTRPTDHAVVVRVDVVPLARPKHARVVACGEARDGWTFDIEPGLADEERAVLVVSVFDRLRESEKPTFAPIRRARVAALATAERQELMTRAVTAWVGQDGATAKVIDAFVKEPSVQRSAAALVTVDEALRRTHGERSGSCTRADPFFVHACARLEGIELRLAAMRAHLEAAKDAPGANAAAPQIALLADGVTFGAPWTAEETENVCTARSRKAWLERGDAVERRRVAAVELPVVTKGTVREVAYDNGTVVANVKRNKQVGMLVTWAPYGEALTFQQKTTTRVETSLADLFAKFLPTLVAGIGKQGTPGDTFAPCGAVQAAADMEAPPIERRTTRATVLRAIDPDYRTEARACAGTSCATDGSNTKNIVELVPDPGFEPALVLQAGFNAIGARLDTPGYAYTRPEYERTFGASGPDELFVAKDHFDLRRLFVTSLLLGARWRRLYIGAGPGLLDGTGSGTFQQWHLAVGGRIAPRLYLLGNGVFAMAPLGTSPDPLRPVVVARDANGNASPPAVSYTNVPVLAFHVGIGLDLAALTDGGDALIKSVRGGGK